MGSPCPACGDPTRSCLHDPKTTKEGAVFPIISTTPTPFFAVADGNRVLGPVYRSYERAARAAHATALHPPFPLRDPSPRVVWVVPTLLQAAAAR